MLKTTGRGAASNGETKVFGNIKSLNPVFMIAHFVGTFSFDARRVEVCHSAFAYCSMCHFEG